MPTLSQVAVLAYGLAMLACLAAVPVAGCSTWLAAPSQDANDCAACAPGARSSPASTASTQIADPRWLAGPGDRSRTAATSVQCREGRAVRGEVQLAIAQCRCIGTRCV